MRAHDSPFFSIRYYGDQLPAFLRRARGLRRGSRAGGAGALGVGDDVRVRRGRCRAARDAASWPASPPEQLGRLRFDWHPCVHRLELAWNVPQLWKALSDDAARPPAALQAEHRGCCGGSELATYFRSLSAAEAAALDAARSGWPFGELCELLCEEVGEAQAPAQAAGFCAAGSQPG